MVRVKCFSCGVSYDYDLQHGICPYCGTPYGIAAARGKTREAKALEKVEEAKGRFAKALAKRRFTGEKVAEKKEAERDRRIQARRQKLQDIELRWKLAETKWKHRKQKYWVPARETLKTVRDWRRKRISGARKRREEIEEEREGRRERLRREYPEFYRRLPRENPVLSFFIFLLILYLLFVVVRLAQTGDLQKLLTGTEIIAEEAVPAAGKTFLYYLMHPDKYIEDKFSWTVGAEKTEEEEKGAIIKSLRSRRDIFKENSPIEVLAYLEVKEFDKDFLDINFLCKMENEQDGKVNVEGTETNKETIYPSESGTTFTVLCTFEDVKLKPEDLGKVTKKVTLEAVYDVETKGELEIWTLSREEYYSLRGDNPFEVLLGRDYTKMIPRIKQDRTMRSTYTGGPLEFSIISKDRQPLFNGKYPITLRLRNIEEMWGGEIDSIDRLEITSSEGLNILNCEDFEESSSNLFSATPSDLSSLNQKISKATLLEFDKNNIEFDCDIEVFGASGSLTQERISSRLGYKYKLKKSTTVTIEKSKEETIEKETLEEQKGTEETETEETQEETI